MTSSRCRREATSGTTPPNRACRSACDETTLERISPPSTSAAAVSSQEVSSPRITLVVRDGVANDRVLPHDQRVLAVVRVVAAPHASGAEAEVLVELDRAGVRDADLERVAAPRAAGGDLEEPVQQHRGDLLPPAGGRDGHVHHVPGVDVAGN